MGLLTRSVRSFGSVAALVAATMMISTPAITHAEEKPQAQPAGDAAAAAAEPVVIVTLSSIDQLIKDVNYLAAAIGQEQAGMMISMMAGTFTEGIDKEKPVGILVPLVDGMPQPVALIPTTDAKGVLKRLEAQLGPADELDDGTLVTAFGATTIYVKQRGDWAVVAGAREHLDVAPTDPTPMFAGMADKYLIAARVMPQRIPENLREMFVGLMRQGFEQAMASQQEGPESVRDLAENSIKQLEMIINETESLELGIGVNTTDKQVELDLVFTGKEGSTLAELYDGSNAIPSQFASVIRDDAIAYVHYATSIGPKAIDQTKNSIKTLVKTADDLISQQDGLNYEVQTEISAYLERIAGLVVDSVSEGRADFGAALVPVEDGIGFVGGAFVSDGNEVAKILKEIAGKIESEPGAPTFKFDTGKHSGVTMHTVDAEIPASMEEARKVFGETLTVHLGTGEKSVYIAIGDDAEGLMKKLIDSGANDTPGDRPIGQAKVKVLPVLELAQGVVTNDTLTKMIDAMAGSEDPGVVQFSAQGIKNGQEFKITISEGVLKGLAAALLSGQQAGF